MLIYFLIPIYLFILSLISPKNQIIKNISFIITAVFLCTTYFNGSDWRHYELMYEQISYNNFYKSYGEFGYKIMTLILKSVGLNFWHFFIIIKMCCFYIFIREIKRISENNFISLLLFYNYIAIYLFIDCPLRNLIAISIFLFSQKYLEKQKYLKFLFLFLLAFMFHKSAIIMLICPFLQKFNKIDRKTLIFLMIIVYILLMTPEIIVKISSFFPFGIEEKLATYYEKTNLKIFSLGSIEKITVIFLLIWNRDKINKKYKRGLVVINFAIAHFIMYRLAMSIPILFRLALYYQIYYIVGIYYLICLFRQRLIRLLIFISFTLYSSYFVFRAAQETYVLIPYVSYINYMFEEKPSYEYRDEYHLMKYIERNGKDEYIRKYLKILEDRRKENEKNK